MELGGARVQRRLARGIATDQPPHRAAESEKQIIQLVAHRFPYFLRSLPQADELVTFLFRPSAPNSQVQAPAASKIFLYVWSMPRLLYLDQNAWVALARAAWDKTEYPCEHASLAILIDAINRHGLIVPLSFTNLYETMKINDPVRRAHMAHVQASISNGRVFRGRRRILGDTLFAYLASRFDLPHPAPAEHWFLSDIWFEAVADRSSGAFDGVLTEKVVDLIRAKPAALLFDYLALSDEGVRREGVRRYSADSADLLVRIEARRLIAAGETLALRRRAYGARLIIDEVDFILATGRSLGLNWRDVRDIGSSLVRRLTVDVPILHAERELAVRIEDQAKPISENDLRDMAAFTTVLPFADIVVAEKSFVNLARQARLGERFETTLLTSIFDLSPSILKGDCADPAI